jgi:Tfp pilus assembly protein PilZ
MDRRNEKRLDKSLLAYTDSNGTDLLGVISNISKNGIFIVTDKIFEINSQISFVLAVYGETYPIKGEVRWVRRPEDQEPGNPPAGMGIRIIEAPVEYLNYVESTKYQDKNSISQRTNPEKKSP